jgi:ribosomal-protein-alanine acetyltransferase
VTTIRRFQPGDLPRVLAIEQDSFGRYAWPAEFFREYWETTPELFLAAFRGRSLAGYVIGRMCRGGAEIASIAVHSRHRRRGVGLALFKAVRRRVKFRGASSIWLMVRPDNESALRFYYGLGFVRTGAVSRYYEDGASGWRLRLDLR